MASLAAAAALLGFMSASATAGGVGTSSPVVSDQSDPAGGPLSGPQVALEDGAGDGLH
jgi:hypothetical protein